MKSYEAASTIQAGPGAVWAADSPGIPAPVGEPFDPFDPLGDPNRREILRMLGDGGKPVREIAEAMPISRPAVSRHLRLLKDAGMVAETAEGTRRVYHLREHGLNAVHAYLRDVWGGAAERFRLLAENTAPGDAGLPADSSDAGEK